MAQILVIDDSAVEVYQLTTLLKEMGHEALSASNGAEGIALAQQHHPDLILMDIVMPGLNGFQATRQLSKLPAVSSIPVVIITHKDQETDRVWAQRQGAKEYLVKPITEERLRQLFTELAL